MFTGDELQAAREYLWTPDGIQKPEYWEAIHEIHDMQAFLDLVVRVTTDDNQHNSDIAFAIANALYLGYMIGQSHNFEKALGIERS